MNEFFVGAAGFMAFKALDKAILEPIAKNIGQKLVSRYLGPACNHLDIALATFGVDCDPEAIVRDYLDLEEELSPEQVEQIVEAVFQVWDIRVAASGTLGRPSTT